jgi:hypothetical protein
VHVRDVAIPLFVNVLVKGNRAAIGNGGGIHVQDSSALEVLGSIVQYAPT